MTARIDPPHDSPPDKLRNIGPASAAWLAAVGVSSREDLERIGPVAAFARVRRVQPRASLNLLWALEAALADRDWRNLAPETKERLRRELADLEN
ncbi:MAG: TfoX/Sxy family DNA transformation protein [Pirellulales bacterium]|nr:TfoX/Sxy family DNA transformation protein [Pirellulales bacterium]MBX3433713.1 TfoX/Sxy family DNA transformation protein [Pirellulales bacterium]